MAKPEPKLPPPPTHPDDPPFACIEINKSWIPYVIGALRAMRYPEYWSGTLQQNRDARQDANNLIHQLSIAGDCMEDNCCPEVPSIVVILHRLSSDGTTLEMSIDNGETWTPDNTDPRSQIAVTPPPVPGVSNTVCDAADNIVQGLQEAQVLISNTASAGGTLQEIALNVILALLAFLLLPPVGAAALTVIVAGIVRRFLEMGKENYDGLFTAERWDITRCAFACALDDDGKLSAGGMSEAKRYIYRHMPGDNTPNGAAQNFVDVINFVGLAGLNLIAFTYQATGANCDDCECDDCTLGYDFEILPYNWVSNGVTGQWVPGEGWKSTYRTIVDGFTAYSAQYEYLFAEPCTPTFVELTWEMDAANGGIPHAYWHLLTMVNDELVWSSGFNLSPNEGLHVETVGSNEPIYGFRFGVVNIAQPSSHYLKKIEINPPPP